MTFKLGDYVQVTNNGQLGRIYQKDRVYAGSPSFLKVQLENENCVEMDKYQPWVHILVHGSGVHVLPHWQSEACATVRFHK
jgi:hypothetical protein